jgi:hypothetical protein
LRSWPATSRGCTSCCAPPTADAAEQELLFKTARAGIRIVDHPIAFVDRVVGESTLTLRKLLAAYVAVLKLRWMALRGRI